MPPVALASICRPKLFYNHCTSDLSKYHVWSRKENGRTGVAAQRRVVGNEVARTRLTESAGTIAHQRRVVTGSDFQERLNAIILLSSTNKARVHRSSR